MKKTPFITEPFNNREKPKQNKRFVIDKKKMPFITEPFYHGEKNR